MKTYANINSDAVIVGIGTYPDFVDPQSQAQTGCAIVEINRVADELKPIDERLIDIDTHFYDGSDGTVRIKPYVAGVVSATTVAADSVSTITVSGLPDPCTLVVIGPFPGYSTVTGGAIDLSFDGAGEYLLRFNADGYLEQRITINAT